jgi:hypothetical protein
MHVRHVRGAPAGRDLVFVSQIDDRPDAVRLQGGPAGLGQAVEVAGANESARLRGAPAIRPQAAEVADVESALPVEGSLYPTGSMAPGPFAPGASSTLK